MNNQESVIREKRTIQATKENLMGPAGKLGVILQAFGTTIVRQGSGLLDVGLLDDPFAEFVETEYSSTMSGQNGPVVSRDEILTSGDDFTYDEGLMFDGLSRGMHIEIVYWHTDNKLIVNYKGYPVYCEIAGELFAYAPFPEWERLVNKLHSSAKERLKQIRQQQEEEIAKKIEKKKSAFWEMLRMRWGI